MRGLWLLSQNRRTFDLHTAPLGQGADLDGGAGRLVGRKILGMEMAQLRYMPPGIYTRIHVSRTMAGRSSLLQIGAGILRFILRC